jgi:hypothetical protein
VKPALDSRLCLVLLLGCDAAVVLVFVYFLSPLWPWGPSHIHLLDPNGEANLPTWYSSSKLLLAGVALAGRAWCLRSPFLMACAALATGMSADETANLHELAGFLLSRHLPPHWQLFGDPSAHMWPYVYGIPAVMVIAVGMWWVRRHDRVVSWTDVLRLAGAFLVFFCGAVGLELVQQWWPQDHVPSLWGSVAVLMLLEESLENAGASLLLWAAVRTGPEAPRRVDDGFVGK